MNKKIQWGDVLPPAIGLLILLAFFGFAIFAMMSAVTEKEISNFTFMAEITHLDKSTYYVKNSGNRSSYSASVDDGNWFSYTFDINGSQYAKWKVGDRVQVKSATYRNIFNIERTEYILIGVEGK